MSFILLGHQVFTQLKLSYLSGKKTATKAINRGTTDYKFDVSLWPRGLYLFRLVYRGGAVGDVKVVVE